MVKQLEGNGRNADGTRIMLLSLSLGMPCCGLGGRENRLLYPIAQCSDAAWLVPNRLATGIICALPASGGAIAQSGQLREQLEKVVC